VQPGDSLQLKIVREGKEADQGVGYLEDGTMVVVEDARQRIGERLPVTITGALQTPTGRMVFARSDRGTEAAVAPAAASVEEEGERPPGKGGRRGGRPGGKPVAAPGHEPPGAG
jgi:hypothetical protein